MAERHMSSDDTAEKLNALRGILTDMRSVLLAFSGGVDSTFLLKVASEVMPDRVLAVTALSATYPQEEHKKACEMARRLGVRHLSISTDELSDPNFASNPVRRCYFCKKALFTRLREISAREDLACVIDASNLDDCSDYRPGREAAEELGVRSPLVEARLTKADIRALSREMGLPTWDQPSMACLASRFPYGEQITPEKLHRVEQAERMLRELGLGQVRVRSHGRLARIEVDEARVQELAMPGVRQEVLRKLKSLGFVYVTVDLEGYRTGSLNEVLRSQDSADGEGGEDGASPAREAPK